MQADLTHDKNLADMIGKLKSHFNPEKIYLFGSRAKGGAEPDSDYDLFLIVGKLKSQQSRRSHESGLRKLKGFFVSTNFRKIKVRLVQISAPNVC